MGKPTLGLACLVLMLLPCGAAPADEEPTSATEADALLLPLALRSPRSIDTVEETGWTWLPSHQCPDGHWSAAEFDLWCRGERRERKDRLPDRGDAAHDVAVTGAALCCSPVGNRCHT